MSPAVYAAFQEIYARESIRGPVLEVGAVVGPESLLRLPCLGGIENRVGINIENLLLAGTPTLGEHFFPSDHYRFSEQAMREVFLADLQQISVRKIMNPPRIVGWGRKP